MKIYVKNMASESCKIVVEEALAQLNIIPIKVELGEIETKDDVSNEQKIALNNKIKRARLEVLEGRQNILIEKIRKVIIEYVYNYDEAPNMMFSVILCKELCYSYTYLANLFAQVAGITIEQFMIALKIERIKELIHLGEDTLTEIAYKLNYSSVAHLSSQFKQKTGLTPSHFKGLKVSGRISIQNIQTHM